MGKTITPVLACIWLSLAGQALAAGKIKADDAFVIAIERFEGGDGGNLDRFRVAKDGSWEFKPQGGKSRKGKVRVEDLTKWVKEIEAGGLYQVKSNPDLGGTDEAF